MTGRAVVTLAAVVLRGSGLFSSVATATGPCNKKVCSEEIAAGCAGLKGMALSVCTKAVLLNCDTTDCSCTDPTLPACGPTTTTTTTISPTPSSSTTTSSSTPTSTTPPAACCTQSTPGGPFDQCTFPVRLSACPQGGGHFFFGRTCTPNPCETTTTTTATTSTTTTTTVPTGCHFPATGQTTCWATNGNLIPCAGTGQDGDLQAGGPLSYTDNGDGTITDNNTGLMWEKQSQDGSIHDVNNTYSWEGAFTEHVAGLNTMNFAGHSDWGAPNWGGVPGMCKQKG